MNTNRVAWSDPALQAWGDRLAIGNCGNSAPTTEAAVMLRDLATVTTKPASVRGHVAKWSDWTGVGRARVIVHGGGVLRQTETDKTGWFNVEVPPGRYSVTIEDPAAEPYDLSYDNPAGFVVERGQCGLVQFLIK